MSNKWLGRLKLILNVIYRSEDQLTESDLSKITLNKNKIIVIKAWNLNFNDCLRDCSEKVRRILTPCCKALKDAEYQITKLRLKYDFLVGVHARRGDYKEYLGGIHYHSWDIYLKWVIETKTTFEQAGKKNIAFLLCSDDQPTNKILDNKYINHMTGNEIMKDIHALSLCDYNIGPPSSFGTWISWYGKVPRCQVEKGVKIESLSQFEVSMYC